MIRRIAYGFLLWLLLSLTATAQTTKVRGCVRDADSGEPLPFAGIFFRGTTIGVTTDASGCYALETRDPSVEALCVQLLGYEPAESPVKRSAFNEIDFRLRPVSQALAPSLVRPDHSYIRRILARIDAARDRNNPEKQNAYQCDIYSRMEFDLTNTDTKLVHRLLGRNLDFLFDHLDTSVVTGQSYLPVLLSETRGHRYHRTVPPLDTEVIEGNRISGLAGGNVLTQFTGSMMMRANFYNNYVRAFNVDIPSPAAALGAAHYQYYLVDSLAVAGRKTYRIRFHPKQPVTGPVFDGEMDIDAQDWAIRSIRAGLAKGSNVNWLRFLVLEIENRRTEDGRWFYGRDRLTADFSPERADVNRFLTVLGTRQIDYGEPVFHVPADNSLSTGESVRVLSGAGEKDEAWWESVRPYPLTEKEKGIYRMAEQVQETPLYRNVNALANTLVTGYYEKGKIGIGSYSRLYNYNSLEGHRISLGLRTTKEFSRRLRLTGHVAYGFGDRAFKGEAKGEYVFNTQPWHKLLLRAKHDYVQLGQGTEAFPESNLLSTLLARNGGGGQKRSMVNEWSARYIHEFTPGINGMLTAEHRQIFESPFVPMIRPDGTPAGSVSSNQLRYTARFSWEEIVSRGTFDKQYLYTKYPVVTLDLAGGIPGISRNDCAYLRPELTVEYRMPSPPLGFANIRLNAGHIFGSVPYPLLKLHEGNATWYLDKTAFSCMDYYEFASDTWATLFYEQNFGGFFINRIPLVRKSRMREIVTFKAAYGTLSQRNDGNGPQALLRFPEGMGSLEKPYVEVGAGLSNIFKLLRIDAAWRLTHRTRVVDGETVPADRRFALTVGMELMF